ncbi:calcium-binding protein [Methylotuvimicrobium sp. KM2]|uniref:calcium-binding protein n=1 Tax=Methylotuvimicrobium sp. KM2 TaxID=3133976 RepID=UPI0031019C28
MATLTGTDDRDIFNATTGNHTIDGKDGLDIVFFNGNSTDYTIEINENEVIVTDINGNDGSNRLINVEKIHFKGDHKQILLSQETLVNILTAGAQEASTLLAYPDGGFINFWQGPGGYYFRKFDTNGRGLGPDQRILTGIGEGANVRPALFSDGSIVLAWSAPDADGSGIHVQLFDAAGKPTSNIFRANDTLTDDQGLPAIAVLEDDKFVVAWSSNNQGDSLQNGIAMGSTPNQTGVFSQLFDKFGNPLDWETKISDSGGSDAFVTALANGGYIIGYEAISTGTEQMLIFAKRFDKDGQFMGFLTANDSGIAINSTFETPKGEVGNPDFNELASEQKFPTSTQLSNGNIVVVWQAPRDAYDIPEQDLDAHDFSIVARLYNASGQALNGEIHVNSFTTYDQAQPAVAALADGGFVVVWQSMLQDESYWGVYGQRFNANGTKVGGEFQVNTTVHDSQQQPTVIGLSDGGFVVSWEAEYQDGHQQGVFQDGDAATEIVMQRYDASGKPLGRSLSGGSGDDTIIANGTVGVDISGGDGNDELIGGDGNDVIRGGRGNNILNGGAGDDILIGGPGNDIFIGSPGNDVIIGGGGSNILQLEGLIDDYTLSVISGIYTLKGEGLEYSIQGVGSLQFADGEVLSLSDDIDLEDGGSTGVTVEDRDTAAASVLKGTDFNDVLIGGNIRGEPDILEGGKGNDLYIALGNRLVIFDTGGIDTLEIAAKVDLSQPHKGPLKGLEYIENVTLTGNGNFKLVGNSSNNVLKGNSGNNRIFGGDGDDIIYGGLGRDRLNGGAGMDTFVFDTQPSGKNRDFIDDFSGDIIRLSSAIYSGLDPNQDGSINFISGPGLKRAHTDTASFLVYNTKTGILYYDAENNSKAEPIVKVGIVDESGFTAANLTVADFEFF